MRFVGTKNGSPLEFDVQDEYDLKKQIEMALDRLKELTGDTTLREDILSRIANSVVEEANLFADIHIGEVTPDTGAIPAGNLQEGTNDC